jgi:lysophospholipase L1-like esterase
MGYHPNYQSGNPAEITIPENVYYIRINYHLACANETAVIPHKLLPWHATGGSSVGKVWCCVGDSLTEANTRASRHYYDYIADELGLTVLNYGISGTGYKNGSFANRIYGSIKEDFDIMTVFGSFNDLDASWELGNITDNGRDTLFGCMNAAVENFLIKYPTKKLALITPTPWKLGVEYFGVETTLENMEAYVNAILAVAKRNRVPCLDLYHCSGLNPDNSVVLTTYYNENGTQDLGVHPNSEGHKFIAPIIREFIKTLV